MILYHCQTKRAVVVVSRAPLHCLTRYEESVGRRVRLLPTANAFPTWKEARSPPRYHFSYADWWRIGPRAMTEDERVEQ